MPKASPLPTSHIPALALATLAILAALAGVDAAIPHFGHCESSDDCDTAFVHGYPLCCHVGDRRCLTMGDCEAANAADNTTRNCECIARWQTAGYAKRFASCELSSDCDPAPTADGQYLCCRMGDRRCLTRGDCEQANADNHTSRSCECTLERCYDDEVDGDEPERDCGRSCPTKCPVLANCNVDADCQTGFCKMCLEDGCYNYCAVPS
eukprot:m51a1_g10861 hypothetical protein (209) ;mRNA; f:23505-24131